MFLDTSASPGARDSVQVTVYVFLEASILNLQVNFLSTKFDYYEIPETNSAHVVLNVFQSCSISSGLSLELTNDRSVCFSLVLSVGALPIERTYPKLTPLNVGGNLMAL